MHVDPSRSRTLLTDRLRLIYIIGVVVVVVIVVVVVVVVVVVS